jgi:cytochrome oxidase Cu insertion factor (SCO1/SenC/PrrC family)
MRWSTFFIVFCVVASLGYAVSRWAGISYTPRMDQQALEIAQVQLYDSQGNPVSFASLKGRPVVVSFGYMSCPDVCPTSLAYLRRELDQLGSDRNLMQPVFVSVDPARDTPGLLSEYIQHFGPDFRAFTGSEAFFELGPKDTATGGYLVSHSSVFYILDEAGRVVSTLSPPHEKGALTALMAKALRSH